MRIPALRDTCPSVDKATLAVPGPLLRPGDVFGYRKGPVLLGPGLVRKIAFLPRHGARKVTLLRGPFRLR